MIIDVVEGIFGFMVEFMFRLVVEILFFYTGEIVLSVLTLGKKKIRWDYYSDVSVTKWMIITELSSWGGVAFWLFCIVFAARFVGN